MSPSALAPAITASTRLGHRAIASVRYAAAALLLAAFIANTSVGASGNYSPFLITRQGAGADVYTPATTGTDFGTVANGTTWLLEGGEITSWADGGDSADGANLWFSVYRGTESRPAFTSEGLFFNSQSGNDKKWQTSGYALDLTASEVQIFDATYNGTYNIDYYFQAQFDWGSQYNSNGDSSSTSVPSSNFYTAAYSLSGFDYYLNGTTGTTTQSSVDGGAATLTGTVGIGKFGAGTTQLTNASNDYTGRTLVAGGTLETTTSGVIPDGSNVVINSGAALSLGAAEAVAAISGTGTLDLGGNTLTTTPGSDSEFSGVISGTSGALTKAGTTILGLAGNNSFTGATTVNAGAIEAKHANALGTTAAGTTVASGAALRLSGGITIGSEALGLTGTGVSSDGALRNISGANEYQGAITLSGATRINSDAGTLTLSTGGISGTHNLTFGGAGDTTVSGVIGTSTGTVTKDGAGTLTLSGANTYTGKTTVSAGTLALSTGVLLASGEIEVTAAGLLDVSGVTGGFALGAGQTLSGNGSIAGSLSMGTTSRMAFSATTPLTLTSGTLSFAAGTAGSRFGIDNLDGLTSATALGTYTLVSGAVDTTNLDNLNAANAYDLGNGVSAYFQEGSLQVVVVPEPAVGLSAAAALIGIGLVLRRCAAREHQAGADRHPVAA
jgi:autotransporter-associated beta strand protein